MILGIDVDTLYTIVFGMTLLCLLVAGVCWLIAMGMGLYERSSYANKNKPRR